MPGQLSPSKLLTAVRPHSPLALHSCDTAWVAVSEVQGSLYSGWEPQVELSVLPNTTSVTRITLDSGQVKVRLKPSHT